MKDVFNLAVKVYYYPAADNLLIINPDNFFMFATVEGSSGKKLCINETEFIKEKNLIYIGEL